MSFKEMSFFPSLYDPQCVVEDIWGCWRDKNTLFKPHPWPGHTTLLRAEYEPLDFYTPPAGGAEERWSELEDICELNIRLKEIELIYQLGEEFDNGRYHFLSTVQYEKEKQMKLQKRTPCKKSKK